LQKQLAAAGRATLDIDNRLLGERLGERHHLLVDVGAPAASTYCTEL
jgi:hypothetical protein